MTELRENILELRNKGFSYNEIVTKLGCSKGSVSYYLGQNQKLKTVTRTRDRRNKVSKFLREFKDSKKCMDCGEQFPHFILQFDHRPSEIKNFQISNARGKTLEDIQVEIKKCDLVCANCHAYRTWERGTRYSVGYA